MFLFSHKTSSRLCILKPRPLLRLLSNVEMATGSSSIHHSLLFLSMFKRPSLTLHAFSFIDFNLTRRHLWIEMTTKTIFFSASPDLFFQGTQRRCYNTVGSFFHFSRFSRLDLGSDSIQVAESLRGETATTVGIFLDQLDGFEGLQHFTGDRAGAGAEM